MIYPESAEEVMSEDERDKQLHDKAIFVAMKFPCGIYYCDWAKLSDNEKKDLWEKHLSDKCLCTDPEYIGRYENSCLGNKA